jgi:predicted TIM-barrel fold metal-dependent hydrolase
MAQEALASRAHAAIAASGCGHSRQRRNFLAGLAVLGAGALLPAGNSQAIATAMPAKPFRIDVHAHLSPPAWIQELEPKKLISPLSVQWSVAKHLEDMDQAGVATAILSVTTPGLWFGDNAAGRRLARECNDFAAKLRAEHPGRFGMFTALPLPDIEGALQEIAYGLDTLKTDGVGLFTSYGDKWLGDPAFDPVFAELNRRKAVVYVHPTSANCCRNVLPGVGDQIIEWGTDTTRAITRMVFGGAAARYPDVHMIFSHAGGTMPYLIDRFDWLAKTPQYAAKLPQGFRVEAERFYYDTAQASNNVAMGALKKLIPASHILFGTDYPFRTATEHVKGLQEAKIFTAKELHGIDRGNATALMPQHAA